MGNPGRWNPESSPWNPESNLIHYYGISVWMYYIQRSNLYVRERNTLFKFTHFSLEQCLGESLEVLCNVHVATFKFRNRVVCLFRKSTFINEAANDFYQRSRELKEVERTIARIFLEVIKGKEFNGTCNISV